MENTSKLYFYPVWLRVWHGINAIGIILLIITGFSMQAGDANSLIPFNTLVSVHNISGLIVSLNYFVYIIGNVVTKNSRFYIIKPKNLIKRPLKQVQYYAFGMFKGMKKPYPLSEKRKFNPLQKYAYVGTMYLVVPVVIATGFALLFPETIIETVYNLSGILLTAVLHSVTGFFVFIFLLIHLYVASIGESPRENFKSIINGWHHV
ncbi:MAG TPA: cytochrome b/b6 domain-containing protein [Prolixibacteraceae bacterium]|nr:cytochrome b/b6 domain-containing protein [Prolixibacteraceae bacterium]